MKELIILVAILIVVIFCLAGCPVEKMDRCAGFARDCVVDIRV